MAILYNFGSVLVDAEEVAERQHLGDFNVFLRRATKGLEAKMEFRSGTLESKDFYDNSFIGLPAFTQPSIGRPLSIEILCVYTGDAPQKFFGGRKDLLVVSGVKSVQTYGNAPKAINQLVEKITDNQYLQPGAFTQGSPIAYYTKALDVSTIFTSFELVAESFSREIFDLVGRLFSTAGSLPIFAPINGYLLVGGMLIKMAGKLSNSLFDNFPFLREDIPFRFDTPEHPIANAKQMVICNDRDKAKLIGFTPGLVNDGNNNKRPALVDKRTFKEYRGDAPYLIISIDGRTRKVLEDFTPKIAAAAMIEKFYSSSLEVQEINILEDAMVLYNDQYYFDKAKNLINSINIENTGVFDLEEFKKAAQLYKAYEQNIRNDVFLNALKSVNKVF